MAICISTLHSPACVLRTRSEHHHHHHYKPGRQDERTQLRVEPVVIDLWAYFSSLIHSPFSSECRCVISGRLPVHALFAASRRRAFPSPPLLLPTPRLLLSSLPPPLPSLLPIPHPLFFHWVCLGLSTTTCLLFFSSFCVPLRVMAEDTPTASAPAGEPAPAEPAPETSQEKVSEKANEPEKEKPSGKVFS